MGLLLTDFRRRHAATWLIIAVWIVVAAITALDYGVSWDEKVQARYGEMAIDYYASGFQDRSYEGFWNLRYYGPFFEMLPALVYRWMPWFKFEIRHIFIALFATLGLIAVKKLGDRASPSVAFFAVLALVLTPAFYGHFFFNSKDIPFAAMFAWAMHGLLRAVERPHWKTLLAGGSLLGAAMAIRVAGVLAIIIVAAGLLVAAVLERTAREGFLRRLGALVAAGVIGWLVMTAFWPWAQADPIGRPLQALRTSASFNEVYDVLFEGRYVPSDRLPLRYLPEMFAITTPLAVLTLIGVGVATSFGAIRRRQDTLLIVTALLWAFVPPILQMVMRAPVYDGTRHFLFMYPAMALIAGVGARALIGFSGRPRLAAVALVIALLGVIPAMIRLHPYQYVYYNAFAGGTRGAEGRYELDYWSTSYREAAMFLENNRCQNRATHVLFAADAFSDVTLSWHLSRDFELRMVQQQNVRGPLPAGWDYYVGLARQEMETNFPEAPVAYNVQRMGATLAVVRGRCVS